MAHLKDKNWDFVIDLMRVRPVTAETLIEDPVKDAIRQIPNEKACRGPEEQERLIDQMISQCKEARTRDGLEACLLFYKEDLFSCGPEPSRRFERFIELLDDNAETFRMDMAVAHRE